MTFTYNLTVPTDITRVRFHLGDVDSATAIFSDEEIQFAIDEKGSYQQAVIACIRSVIGRISTEPDFKADWLQVDQKRALDGWKELLKQKQQEFGIAAITSEAKAVYRSDSLQTEAPEDW